MFWKVRNSLFISTLSNNNTIPAEELIERMVQQAGQLAAEGSSAPKVEANANDDAIAGWTKFIYLFFQVKPCINKTPNQPI